MKDHLELSDIFQERSIDERMLDLSKRLAAYRKRQGYTQLQLSDRSGIPYGTIKLFERTGHISVEALWHICIALGCDDELEALFSARKLTAYEIRRGL